MSRSRATTEGYLTLDELIACLVESSVETVSASETLVGDANRQPLSALYREIARRMTSDLTAMRVLDLCVWLTSGLMTIDQMNQYMTGHSEPASIEKFRITAAMTKLTRLALVVRRAQAVEMNELTREMLREYLGHRVSEALKRFKSTILDAPIDSLDDNSKLLVFEFNSAKEALATFIGRGDAGMVCLSEYMWLSYERDAPWREAASLGDGLTLLEVMPKGVRLRQGETQWTYGSLAQTRLVYELIELSVRRAGYVYSEILDSLPKVPPGLMTKDPNNDPYRHLWLEPIDNHFHSDSTQAWALCGLREVPSSDSELSLCPACEHCP